MGINWNRTHILICWAVILGFSLMGCGPSPSSQKNILLVLVEGLGDDPFSCQTEPLSFESKSLQKICPEFSKFSRAFSPSSLIQPSMASVLSGLKIDEHQVFHNGPVSLAAGYKTLAEKAIESGYRTGFFSGGLPLLNKFGIHQGYEVFHTQISSKAEAVEPFGVFLGWWRREVAGAPFFATLYVPRVGEAMGKQGLKGVEGEKTNGENLQKGISKVLETLGADTTHIIIAGLSGSKGSGPDDIKSAQTQVSVFMRMVGAKLPSLWTSTFPLRAIYEVGARALKGESINEADLSLFSKLPLKVQSSWGVWREGRKQKKVGFRKDPYFVQFLPRVEVFNSFADPLEEHPLLYYSQPVKKALRELALEFPEAKENICWRSQWNKPGAPFSLNSSCGGFEPEKGGPRVSTFLKIKKEHAGNDSALADFLSPKCQSGEYEVSSLACQWLIQWLLLAEKWTVVLELAQRQGAKGEGLEYVALKNLKRKVGSQDGCLAYFENSDLKIENFYKSCGNISLLRILEGARDLNMDKKPSESFRLEMQRLRSLRVAKNRNLEMDLVNDVRHAMDLSLNLSELYFFLPMMARHRKLILSTY